MIPEQENTIFDSTIIGKGRKNVEIAQCSGTGIECFVNYYYKLSSHIKVFTVHMFSLLHLKFPQILQIWMLTADNWVQD